MNTDEREARMLAAAARVRERAAAFGGRLTPADPPTGEQWDRGQVLSHVAEFLPYWTEELEGVVAAGGEGHPFGRTKETPSRLERIEAGRHRGDEEQLNEMDEGIARVVTFMRDLDDADWELVGTHPSLGRMTVADAVDAFIVAHLEQHCDQLAT